MFLQRWRVFTTLIFTALAIATPFPPSVSAATNLATRLSGRILLQVESRGEAWYVDPLTRRRFSLGRPEDALTVMRSLGLGIRSADLRQIPTVDETSVGDTALRSRLSGRILLQVENKGEAWYVDPLTQKRIYLGRPADALTAMRRFGLGVTNANLSTIPTATNPVGTIRQNVPFTSQAPSGRWSDPRQQDGCEEASVLMAVAWARETTLTKEGAEASIIAMSDWEKEQFGFFMDTSIDDTAAYLLRDYLKFTHYTVRKNITTEDIKETLRNNRIAIVAASGQILKHPNFTGGGPLRHMVVVIGWDESTKTFITHEPGTQNGAFWPYSESIMAASLLDYPSGDHAPLAPMPTAMIEISKE